MMEFRVLRNEVEDQIALARMQEKAAHDIANDQQNTQIHLRHKLAMAAFHSITTETHQEAWGYLKEQSPYDDDEWEIIQDRLPKFVKLTEDPNELYLRVKGITGRRTIGQHTTAHAQLLPADKLALGFNQHLLQINHTVISPHTRVSELTYPQYHEHLSGVQGTLLGHQEVAAFLSQIQDDPIHQELLYVMALELCSQPLGAEHWRALPDFTRHVVVDEALQFLTRFPNSHGDRYSAEYDELPKVFQLIGVEASVDSEPMKDGSLFWEKSRSEDKEKLQSFYREHCNAMHKPMDAAAPNFSSLLSRAQLHWMNMGDLEWNSVEY